MAEFVQYKNAKPPRSQYNRNLTFKLTGGGAAVVFTFPIRPGEFERMHPARVTTTQTLQGVYQDFGGLGVSTLRLQGHTGWRRKRLGADNTDMDGYECFKMLYNRIYREYHRRVSAAKDVNSIKLMLIDDLNETAYTVSMDDFQAHKSKASPLLYNYVILMTIQSTGESKRDAKDLVSNRSVALDSNLLPLRLGEVLNQASKYDPKVLRSYTVLKGDNLQKISMIFFGTVNRWKSIADLNGITTPYAFEYGRVLKIPW